MNVADAGLLLKMAQQAGKDSTLVASQIEAIAKKNPGGWAGVARSLHIDDARLARLALCRRPQPKHFEAEVQQIAKLVGVEPSVLSKLFTETRPAAQRREVRPAVRPWMWATGLVLVGLLLLSAFVFINPAGSSATLIVDQGAAKVRPAQGLSAWLAPKEKLVSSGQMLAVKKGDQISLDPGATGQVRFFDGSQVELSSGAQLVIQELNTSDGNYRVRLQQLGGVTLSRVMRLLGVNDFFEIHTPSSTVSVRGTVFTVDVQTPQSSLVRVEKGLVNVAMGDQVVEVRPGEQVQAVVGQPLQVTEQGSFAPQNQPGLAPTPVPPSAPGAGSPGVSTPPGTGANPPAGTPAQPGTGIIPGTNPGDPSLSNPGAPQVTEGPAPSSGGSTTGGTTSGGTTKVVPGSPPETTTGGSPPSGGAQPPGHVKNPPKDDTEKNTTKRVK